MSVRLFPMGRRPPGHARMVVAAMPAGGMLPWAASRRRMWLSGSGEPLTASAAAARGRLRQRQQGLGIDPPESGLGQLREDLPGKLADAGRIRRVLPVRLGQGLGIPKLRPGAR